MSRPLPPVIVSWASTTNYPAGSDDWSGQPLKVAPAGTYITPDVPFAAENENYLLNQLFGGVTSLFAMAGQAPAWNWSDNRVLTLPDFVDGTGVITDLVWSDQAKMWVVAYIGNTDRTAIRSRDIQTFETTDAFVGGVGGMYGGFVWGSGTAQRVYFFEQVTRALHMVNPFTGEVTEDAVTGGTIPEWDANDSPDGRIHSMVFGTRVVCQGFDDGGSVYVTYYSADPTDNSTWTLSNINDQTKPMRQAANATTWCSVNVFWANASNVNYTTADTSMVFTARTFSTSVVGPTEQIRALTYDTLNAVFVLAVEKAAGTYFYTSSDAITWTARGSIAGVLGCTSVVALGSLYVCLAGYVTTDKESYSTYYSVDLGATWTDAQASTSSHGFVDNSGELIYPMLISNGNKLVMLGQQDGNVTLRVSGALG